MKKVFALLAITSFMVACNNSTETTETAADSTAVVAPETAPADSTTIESATPADTTHAH